MANPAPSVAQHRPPRTTPRPLRTLFTALLVAGLMAWGAPYLARDLGRPLPPLGNFAALLLGSLLFALACFGLWQVRAWERRPAEHHETRDGRG